MSRYWKRKIKVILWIGIPLGLFLVAVQEIFHIPEEIMMKNYIVFSGIAILLAVTVNGIWQFRFQRKLKTMQEMLNQEGMLDLFIEQTNEMLKKMKSNLNRNQLLINLSVGYCEKGEYKTAKEMLQRIEKKSLSGIIKVIYYHDLAYYCFMLNETAEAVCIMEEHRKEFEKWKHNKYLGPNLLINEIYLYLSKNQKSRAEELAMQLEKMERGVSLERSFQLVKKKLHE